MTLHGRRLLEPRAFSPSMKRTTATAITALTMNLTLPAIVTITNRRALTALLVAHLTLVALEDQADLVVILLTVAMMTPVS